MEKQEQTPPAPPAKPKRYGVKALMEAYGYSDVTDLARDCVMDSVSPGICTVCGYTTDVEPDCRQGWCEECERGTVRAALDLMGMI